MNVLACSVVKFHLFLCIFCLHCYHAAVFGEIEVFTVAIKRLLFAADDTGTADISAVACCTLKKLLVECQKLFTSRNVRCSTPVESFCSSLVTDLNKGLLSALDKNHYSPSCTKPYASSSVRLIYLFFRFYFKPETDREFKFVCHCIC